MWLSNILPKTPSLCQYEFSSSLCLISFLSKGFLNFFLPPFPSFFCSPFFPFPWTFRHEGQVLLSFHPPQLVNSLAEFFDTSEPCKWFEFTGFNVVELQVQGFQSCAWQPGSRRSAVKWGLHQKFTNQGSSPYFSSRSHLAWKGSSPTRYVTFFSLPSKWKFPSSRETRKSPVLPCDCRQIAYHRPCQRWNLLYTQTDSFSKFQKYFLSMVRSQSTPFKWQISPHQVMCVGSCMWNKLVVELCNYIYGMKLSLLYIISKLRKVIVQGKLTGNRPEWFAPLKFDQQKNNNVLNDRNYLARLHTAFSADRVTPQTTWSSWPQQCVWRGTRSTRLHRHTTQISTLPGPKHVQRNT